mmetsp:Transcript_20814/g.41840  ORF Transcript_20814/g.41840 Transcript_20814/m.41840 type:complete len:486 (-) Transcript_20814:318-1775(-)
MESHLGGLAIVRLPAAIDVRQQPSAQNTPRTEELQALLHEELLADIIVPVALALVALMGIQLDGLSRYHLERSADARLGALGLLLRAIRVDALDSFGLATAVAFSNVVAVLVDDDVHALSPIVFDACLAVGTFDLANRAHAELVFAGADDGELPLRAVCPTDGHGVDALARGPLACVEVRGLVLSDVNRSQGLPQSGRHEHGVRIDLHSPIMPHVAASFHEFFPASHVVLCIQPCGAEGRPCVGEAHSYLHRLDERLLLLTLKKGRPFAQPSPFVAEDLLAVAVEKANAFLQLQPNQLELMVVGSHQCEAEQRRVTPRRSCRCRCPSGCRCCCLCGCCVRDGGRRSSSRRGHCKRRRRLGRGCPRRSCECSRRRLRIPEDALRASLDPLIECVGKPIIVNLHPLGVRGDDRAFSPVPGLALDQDSPMEVQTGGVDRGRFLKLDHVTTLERSRRRGGTRVRGTDRRCQKCAGGRSRSDTGEKGCRA